MATSWGEDNSYSFLNDNTPSQDYFSSGSKFEEDENLSLGGGGTFQVNQSLAPAAKSSGVNWGWTQGAIAEPSTKSEDPWAGHVKSSQSSIPYAGSGRGGSSSYKLDLAGIPKFKSSGEYVAADYDGPDWDEERVRELTEKKAMAGRGQLRRGLIGAVGGVAGMSDSPILQKYQLGKVYEEFGEGVGKNEALSETAAERAYEKEFGAEQDEAKMDYEAASRKAEQDFTSKYQADMAGYQAQLNAWLGGKTTEDTNTGYTQNGITYSYHR